MATEETTAKKPNVPPSIAISPATAGVTSSLLTPRYIPGAPPPSAKPTKKKRAKAASAKAKSTDGDAKSDREIPDAHSAALIETAPTSEDIKEGLVAKELVAEAPEAQSKQPSIIVESLNKRIKNNSKRIARIAPNAEKDPATLNEDQKRNLALLPSLEAALKELEDIKKNIITIEAEQDEKLALQREEREQIHQNALKAAVDTAKTEVLSKFNTVLSFLSLSSALSSQSIPITIPLDDIERSAIARAADLLLDAEDTSQRDVIVNGLIDEGSIGEVDGVPYSRLRSITNTFIRPPTPPAESFNQPPISSNVSDVGESAVPPSFTGSIPGPSSSFQFMQESDLEVPSGSLTFGAVNAIDDSGVLTAVDSSLDTGAGDANANLAKEWVEVEKEQEQYPTDDVNTGASGTGGAIDWAADDAEELPSLDSIQAKFGTSGQATPIESDQPAAAASGPLNGDAAEPGTPVTPSGESEWRHAGGGERRGRRGFGEGGYR
ncbi:hypothetical protein FRC02_010299, partial [Tulasnella sp. 418]